MSSDPPEPTQPVITIRTTSANVSDLRTRFVRERPRPDGHGGARLVREVLEAFSAGDVVAATLDVGGGGPP